MPSHVAVALRCFRWRRTSMTSREKLPYAYAESDSYIKKKLIFQCYKLLQIAQNIYSYIIKGLLHWYQWILSLVGISTDAHKIASFDIPTRDNIHRHQGNNPIHVISSFFVLCWVLTWTYFHFSLLSQMFFCLQETIRWPEVAPNNRNDQ